MNIEEIENQNKGKPKYWKFFETIVPFFYIAHKVYMDNKDEIKVERKDLVKTKEITLCLLGKSGSGKSQISSLLGKSKNTGFRTKTINVDTSVDSKNNKISFRSIDQPGFDGEKVNVISCVQEAFKESRRIHMFFIVFSANRLDYKDILIRNETRCIREQYPNNSFYVITSCPENRIDSLKEEDEYKSLKLNDDEVIFVENPEPEHYSHAPKEVRDYMVNEGDKSFNKIFSIIRDINPVIQNKFFDPFCIIS